MNPITTEQNNKKQIQRLAAQRQLYATAKKVFGVQLVLSGPVAIASAVIGIFFSTLKGYIGLWGILVVLGDLFWLSPWQKRLRASAAGVQEVFDCDVLSLPWNALKAGMRPDPELIKEQSDKYARRASKMPPLNNWYPVEYGDLPLHVGRIGCQRSNCWWDSKQRRRYAVSIIIGIIVVFIVVLCAAMYRNLTIEDFILKVVAPLAPALSLGIRQFKEHMDAAARLDKLKEHSERLWNDALNGAPESTTTTGSRGLQDEILENRKQGPLVFDAFFKWHRRDYEAHMNYSADELASEARRRLKLT